MPKPINVLLTVAAIGGGAYWYDQNVQPLYSKREIPPIQTKSSNTSLNKDLKKLDTKARDFGNTITSKFESGKDEAEKQTQSTFDSIKNSDFVNRITNNKDVKDFKESAKQGYVPIADKSLPHRLVDYYIDAVNSLGDKTVEKTDDVRGKNKGLIDVPQKNDGWSSWFGSKKSEAEKKADEASKKLEQEKKSWFSWGSDKKSEADKKAKEVSNKAEAKGNEWFNWGSAKKDETEKSLKDWNKEKIAQADEARLKYQKEAKDTLDSQQKKWSQTYEVEKQAAIDNYNKAKHNLEDLTKKLSDKTSALFGSKPAEKEEHLRKANEDLHSAVTNLKKYGNDVVAQIDQGYYQPLKDKVSK